MDRIESPDDLAKWLEDKPIEWAQVIALRIALRDLPNCILPSDYDGIYKLPLVVFQTTFIAWTRQNDPDGLPDLGLREAADDARDRASSNFDNGVPARLASYTVFAAAEAAYATLSKGSDAIGHTKQAADWVRALDWADITKDCVWLAPQIRSNEPARVLVNRPLWQGPAPAEWQHSWSDAASRLLAIDRDFAVWIEWYDRRVRGEIAAFDIPGDKDRKEERELLRRIAGASGGEFWQTSPRYVNPQIAQWLAEARERAAENLSTVTDDQPTVIPAQNNQALRFEQDPEGKIVLSPDTNPSELRKDEDARDRHLLAVEDAKQLLAACAGLNSAERLTAILTGYIAAAGETLEEMRPSLFVQKGERLRQELARYEAGDTDLPPLLDRVLLDLKSVCKAHNMVVGLDPGLMARDNAQLPPDAVVGNVTPAEVRDFVHGADEAGILHSDVPNIMDEAVALVPPGADATDRRFRWCVESCRNLVIEAFAVTLNRPAKMASTVTAVAMLGPGLLVGNALNTAKFLIESRTWIEDRLGRHAPTWNALFIDLCDRLERDTPLGATVKKS